MDGVKRGPWMRPKLILDEVKNYPWTTSKLHMAELKNDHVGAKPRPQGEPKLVPRPIKKLIRWASNSLGLAWDSLGLIPLLRLRLNHVRTDHLYRLTGIPFFKRFPSEVFFSNCF